MEGKGNAPCVEVTGKAIHVQAWTGPEGSRRLTLPDFQSTLEGG